MTDDPSGEDELALQRWGTRFASSDVERAFLAWRLARTAPLARLVIAVGLVLWAALHVTLMLSSWDAVGPLTPAFVVAYGLFGWTASVLARRDAVMLRRAASITLAVTSSLGVGIAYLLGDLDHGAIVLAAATLGCFFVLGSTAGDSALLALPGALAFVVGAQLARGERWAQGDIGIAALAVESLALWMSLLIGLVLALGVDRAEHTAYRQERIIEAQRATIARQQELLERELSHQVAERSRELGAVLARSDVTLDVRALKTGERFAERYKIVSALGAGGMGAVYEVERVTDAARLALKAVVGEVSGASAARFAREAEIGARIRHPSLISIVDVGVSSGVPFLVMELVRGGSLEAQRARFGDVEWALPILRQIAEGLAALHDAGVVHRDLKPANVLLADGGVAKISDFGISRFGALDEGTSIDPSAATMAATPKKSAELTGTGVVMGTPLYMAPEGARSARALDASADVFAFGILAYEMLTGRAPFAVPAFVLAMAEQPIPVPPAIDDARVVVELRTLVLACLAGDPAQRPRVRSLLSLLG